MIVAIIQARLGSTRLPGKILLDLVGQPLIWHVIERLKFSKRIDRIVLATTVNANDDKLALWAEKNDVVVYRGDERNVLERFYIAAKQNVASTIVRITADDPFKDPVIIDKIVDLMIKNNLDFAYNNQPPTFPEGLDTEIFSFDSLEKAYFYSENEFDREHVTPFLYKNKDLFKQQNYPNNLDLSRLRWTIDTEQDYLMTKRIYELLYKKNKIFLLDEILECLRKYPEISEINNNVARSFMYKTK